jgi:hypothetical protein
MTLQFLVSASNPPNKEIIFVVEEDVEGGYFARALEESIFTQADDLETLRSLVKDAVECHFPNAFDLLQQLFD